MAQLPLKNQLVVPKGVCNMEAVIMHLSFGLDPFQLEQFSRIVRLVHELVGPPLYNLGEYRLCGDSFGYLVEQSLAGSEQKRIVREMDAVHTPCLARCRGDYLRHHLGEACVLKIDMLHSCVSFYELGQASRCGVLMRHCSLLILICLKAFHDFMPLLLACGCPIICEIVPRQVDIHQVSTQGQGLKNL